MLIIEGSDNLGKTTFAKKLVRYVIDNCDYPCMYSWMTRPNEKTFDFLYDYKLMINAHTVQDRFHLGALAYHENKLPVESLRRVENWIQLAGGLVVVFYAGDENWYKEWIAKDTRGNLLTQDILCKANSRFAMMAYAHDTYPPHLDYTFDISKGMFPNDSWVKEIADCWMLRRQRRLNAEMEIIKP